MTSVKASVSSRENVCCEFAAPRRTLRIDARFSLMTAPRPSLDFIISWNSSQSMVPSLFPSTARTMAA